MNQYDTSRPYAAAYVILRKGNKVAFVLRENTGWMNGYYGLPAGKVEKNETYTAAAIREAKEEAGVDLMPEHVRFVHLAYRNEDMEWVDIYFEADQYEGEPYNAEPHVHAELAWFDVDNLPDNVIASSRYALEQLQQGKQYSEYVD